MTPEEVLQAEFDRGISGHTIYRAENGRLRLSAFTSGEADAKHILMEIQEDRLVVLSVEPMEADHANG